MKKIYWIIGIFSLLIAGFGAYTFFDLWLYIKKYGPDTMFPYYGVNPDANSVITGSILFAMFFTLGLFFLMKTKKKGLIVICIANLLLFLMMLYITE